MFKFIKKIMLVSVVIVPTFAYAAKQQDETCHSTNAGFAFRQVVIGIGEGGGRCDYGPDFDFKHSYVFEGDYEPKQGQWEGSSDPYIVFCNESSQKCVFGLKS